MISVFSTKKLSAAQKSTLLACNITLVEADLIQITYLQTAVNTVNPAVIFTSQHAVQALISQNLVDKLNGKVFFCVGEKTAEKLNHLGFNVANVSHSATALVESLKLLSFQSFTFFCGKQRLDTIPEFLATQTENSNFYELYETTEFPLKVNRSFDALLFFSPSAVKSFLQYNPISTEVCVCIGETTATALENRTDKIVLAKAPTIENTIYALLKYFKLAPSRAAKNQIHD
ncbi:uroporphyrinogen-III synthase [Flavobacterium sp.]|uniref:uroporphyrinogen-III synthase n=1 Tax=Flavobacterium sp. TaxID=239 RepID=UPI002604F48B|nr:uroporphyrinogen-III synthase [Flavobacterium sp.]